ncbi:TetR/AcrR family transcriptional regulator [Nonomuraea ferruginea]
MELLWRDAAGDPRQGLSVDAIVRAGIEVADAEGLSGLSMRKVAERLGFTTMSLYRHVPSRDHLVDLMRDAAIGALPPPPPPRHPSAPSRRHQALPRCPAAPLRRLQTPRTQPPQRRSVARRWNGRRWGGDGRGSGRCSGDVRREGRHRCGEGR